MSSSGRLQRATILFLFGSGFCALVYQVAWLRLLRLVFGASTAASAAVLAIFMAGLGLGSLKLGPRADRVRRPLLLYGTLEVGIAVAAAASPWAITAIAALYRSAGGSESLGVVGGALIRLALATVVLGIPTFLMGGTLPAAVRAVTAASDRSRRALGLLYGANTTGAVAGAALTTFVFIEQLGTRKTILLAAALNALVAVMARSLARSHPPVEEQEELVTLVAPVAAPPRRRTALVISAAGVVGFAFFLMELVWYRILTPIMGGTTYTFGIILAVALAGVGLGGWLYGALARNRPPTLGAFGVVCAVEALAMAVPFAIGDQLAYVAWVLRDLQSLGFAGMTVGWVTVAVIAIFPASLVAGYQFPLLVAVLGEGRRELGREVGLAYAANTAGAIVGSVAGGFGLIPILGALGTWKLVSWVLIGLAAVSVAYGGGWRWTPGRLAVAATALLSWACLSASGPGPYWRHSGIGAGRGESAADANSWKNLVHRENRGLVWEEDGLESSIAVKKMQGYSFAVNGKTDGHSRLDAPTQVMSSLIGAVLHPDPRRALVIGLGTGSSAGWLAEVESIEQVDVYELERAVLRVAVDCGPVNFDVMEHPKVEVVVGDGRELLLTTDARYDLIVSEPSNPYRAGISSMFTEEYYRAVVERLEPSGIFSQWLQAYEVDGEVVRIVYTTLASVFPVVETWATHRGDLLLVASMGPIDHDLDRIRREVGAEPYRSGLQHTWGLGGAEGFYAGYVASPGFTRRVVAADPEPRNTDDLPIIEYGFARGLGRQNLFSVDDLRSVAQEVGEARPTLTAGDLAWDAVLELREAREIMLGMEQLPAITTDDEERRRRHRARQAYLDEDLGRAASEWLTQSQMPVTRADWALVAEAMAAIAHPRAEEAVASLRELEPVEADAAMARLWYEKGDLGQATLWLERAFIGYRTDPWPQPMMMVRAAELAVRIARRDPTQALRLHQLMGQPFVLHLLDEFRIYARYRVMKDGFLPELCRETFEAFEPYPFWEEEFLDRRRACYVAASHPRASQAARDLDAFRDQATTEPHTLFFER